MNQKLCNRLIFFLPTVVLGGLSLVLHTLMLANCFDDRGLLIPGNVFGRMMWVAGIAYGMMLLLVLRGVGGNGTYADNFPRSLWQGGLMAAAGALLTLTLPKLELVIFWQQLLAMGAAASMVLLGLVRMSGRKPVFGLSSLVCLMYMLLLVNDYRGWSSSPKVYIYAYQLLALVLAMLCAFHRTCADAGILQRKKFLFTAFAGTFCAIAALTTAPVPELYLSTALWNMGCVCTTSYLPPDPAEEETPAMPGEPIP